LSYSAVQLIFMSRIVIKTYYPEITITDLRIAEFSFFGDGPNGRYYDDDIDLRYIYKGTIIPGKDGPTYDLEVNHTALMTAMSLWADDSDDEDDREEEEDDDNNVTPQPYSPTSPAFCP
jgi:hypothetical protein